MPAGSIRITKGNSIRKAQIEMANNKRLRKMKRSITPILLKAGLAACLLLGLTACKTTRQITKESYNHPSGFLGDYSRMHEGSEGQANLVYFSPEADWARYKKIWIQPVELWKSDDPKSPINRISPENRKKLIDLFHTALYNTLSAQYTMVEQGGPDVFIVHAAITEFRRSTPVVGEVSAIYLPLKLVSLGKQTLQGTAIGVGSVTIEAEFLDGETNERLAAILDARSGTSAIRSKFTGTFGDIDKSFRWWAERLKTRIEEEKQGKTDL
ncbi:MAG: hypothetical protein CVT94_18695 [Bacteroidetes bacterium HGW-Bacteroidetes-11]|nr:MAG: hypothetical protein CVT94_18695 [Bacteroidetes bacterium HGW-Bacteroidetes-11]